MNLRPNILFFLLAATLLWEFRVGLSCENGTNLFGFFPQMSLYLMEENQTGIALSVCAKVLSFSNFRKTTPTQFPLQEGISNPGQNKKKCICSVSNDAFCFRKKIFFSIIWQARRGAGFEFRFLTRFSHFFSSAHLVINNFLKFRFRPGNKY